MKKEINVNALASQIMFKLNDEQLIEVNQEIEKFEKYLDILNKIDTTNVSEMIYPLDEYTTFLRDDENVHIIERDRLLSNSENVIEGHLVLPKVVK